MKFQIGDVVRRIIAPNRGYHPGTQKVWTLEVGTECVVSGNPYGGEINVIADGVPFHAPHYSEYFELVRREEGEPVAAARSTDPATSKGKRKVNKYEQAVLFVLTNAMRSGYTGKEIAFATEHPLNCITPRFAPLRRKGLIKDSGERRDKQIVWVLA